MKRKGRAAILAVVLGFSFGPLSAAAPPPPAAPEKSPEASTEKAEPGKFEPFVAESHASNGSVGIGGQTIAYQAVAGTLIVHPKEWDDVARDPKAEPDGAAPTEEIGRAHV